MTILGKACGAVLLAAAMAGGGGGFAAAQTYPDKTVRIVVPVAPGGPMDMIARLLAEKLAPEWGQPVVVENMPGGGQVIATQSVATSAPDGYTLLLMAHSFAMNPWLFDKLPYDQSALAPITQVTETPLILVVNPDLPVTTVQELIDYARANPGVLSFGSSGPSSSLRFAAELLKSMADIDIEHVPYDGNGPMTVAILSGEVQMGFANPVSLPYIEAGQVRALAVTSTDRIASLPDLPTMAETPGLEGFEAGSWFGVMAPAGVDPAVLAKINADVNAALKDAEVAQRLKAVDATPKGRTAEDFAAYIVSETERWGKIIRDLNLKAN